MLLFLAGAAVGVIVVGLVLYLYWQGRSAVLAERLVSRELRLQEVQNSLAEATGQTAQLREERSALAARLSETERGAAEKLALVQQAQEQLAAAFRSLSAEALQHNQQSFLNLAHHAFDVRQQALQDLVRPLQESLGQLELRRTEAYAGLQEQVKSLASQHQSLQTETARLVQALRAPTVRGRWGELQLRRVVELAGMVDYCDFREQQSVESSDGRLRPDMVIHLPNQRQIVVDSKVSLSAYLDSLDASDDSTRRACLADHSDQIRSHLGRLSQKAYWAQFEATPEFVVAFLPGETIFSAALEHDPSLLEYGVNAQVLIATPTTLIALLKAVAYGWRQEKLAQNAQEISQLGRELYDRLGTCAEHIDDLRKNLDRAVQAYNRVVGSLESRVFVSARRFQELGAGGTRELPALESIDAAARNLSPTSNIQ